MSESGASLDRDLGIVATPETEFVDYFKGVKDRLDSWAKSLPEGSTDVKKKLELVLDVETGEPDYKIKLDTRFGNWVGDKFLIGQEFRISPDEYHTIKGMQEMGQGPDADAAMLKLVDESGSIRTRFSEINGSGGVDALVDVNLVRGGPFKVEFKGSSLRIEDADKAKTLVDEKMKWASDNKS